MARLVLAAAFGLLAMFGAVMFGGPAAAQTPESTVTINLVDPDAPDVEHHFFVLGAPRIVLKHGESASVPVVPGQQAQISPSFAGTGTVFYQAESQSCDGLQYSLGTAFTGVWPATDINCTFVVDRSTSVEVVTIAPDDPSTQFEYVLGGGVGIADAVLSDGESWNFPVPPGGPLYLEQRDQPGWAKSVSCTSSGTGVDVPGFIDDVDLQLAPGEQAVCTFSNIKVGPASLTVVFESDEAAAALSIMDPETGQTVSLTPGESLTASVDGSQIITSSVSSVTPSGLRLEAACEGDQGLVTIDADGLSGQLPEGADVVCTFSGSGDAIITLVTTVTGSLDADFDYELRGAGFAADVTQGRADSDTISIPPDTPVTLRSLANGDWIPAMWCTGPLGGFVLDNSGAGAEITLPKGADVTCTYEHTLDQTPRFFVVLNAPGAGDEVFSWRARFASFELVDGEVWRTTVPVSGGYTADTWREPLEWAFDVDCTGTAAAPILRDIDYAAGVTGFFAAAGEVSVCVFTAEKVGLVTVVFEVDSDDPSAEVALSDPYRGATVVASPGSPVSVSATAARLGFGLRSGNVNELLPGGCDGPGTVGWNVAPDGTIPDSGPILSGLPQAGTSVTCTIVVRAPATVPISMTVNGPDVPYNGQVRVNGTTTETLSPPAGSTWTSDVPLGNFIQLGVFSQLPDGVELWSTVSFTCVGDGGALTFTQFSDAAVVGGELPNDGSVTAVDCTLVTRLPGIPAGVYPTVTCLAGNGRIDVNVLNLGLLEATYTLEVGSLNARSRVVNGLDWWRSPVTGRADGPIPVKLTRNGVVIMDTVLTVACDDNPAVSVPEVQVITACRAGNGFVAWQFANPTAESRGYVISFDGVSNRSTTAGPYGASVRGVSGRPDGTYGYTVRANGVIIEEGSVTVACD